MYATKSSLEVAVEAAARVDAVLAKKGRIKPSTIATVVTGKGPTKTPTDLFSTEFEINDVPLTARNLLTKGITQEEINHFSGALISTRGRYIHPEDKGKIGERPLYLYIQGPNKQSLDLAIQRIDSLIKEAMEQEMMKIRSSQPPPPQPPQQSMITGLPQQGHMPVIMSLPGIEKVLVGLDHAPPSFDVRSRVLGPGGANLQYISNETGSIVTLRGRGSGFPEPSTGQESPEPLHLCVEHSKPEVLQQGRQLAFNLIETIQQEFASQVHGQQVVPPPSLLLQQGQIVTVPPPSLGVPPPQLMHQPPPHVQLPPPGIHIPAQQGPLVPPPSAIPQPTQQQQQHHHQQQQQQQQQHQLLVQQHPPPPQQQPHVSTSQAAAVAAVQMQFQQQQQAAAIAASQGQVQVTAALSQPPPTFTHPHPQMMTSAATQVINGIANQHQQHPPPLSQHQQQQAIITQTSYPVQYIQANGQTIMAYPAGTIRPEQLAAAAAAAAQQPGATGAQPHLATAHIPTAQIQPGQQIVLQPATVTGQPQQVQLAQLMQNQTIQQHLLHQAQQGQPGTVMLLQYPQSPQQPHQQGHITTSAAPPTVVSGDHAHGNAIVRMPISVRMTVPVQQQPPQSEVMTSAQTQLTQLTTSGGPHSIPPQQLQYNQQGKMMQQMQNLQSPPQQQQLQMQVQPPLQMHHHHPHPHMQMPPQQQIQQLPPQSQQQQQQQQHLQVQQQQMQQQSTQQQPHLMPRQQPPQQMKTNQDVSHQDGLTQSQQLGQKRRYPNSNSGNSNSNSQQTQPVYQQQQAPQPVPPPVHQHGNTGQLKQQPSANKQQQRQGVGNVPQQQQQQHPPPQQSPQSQQPQTQQQGQSPQQQLPDGSVGGLAPAGGPAGQQTQGQGDWQNPPRHQQSPDHHQQQLPSQSPNRDDNKQPDIKRGRLGNGDQQQQHHPPQHQPQARVDRPTFNHYSSKPQMYNSQLPFHMHQLGMYPPPPPPPPPPPSSIDSPVGQYAPYYQQPHSQPQPQFNPSSAAPAGGPAGYNPYWLPPQ